MAPPFSRIHSGLLHPVAAESSLIPAWPRRKGPRTRPRAGQGEGIEAKLALHAAGWEVPWVLLDGHRIIGAITLSGIVRGPFLNAHIGYWIDREFNGRGIGSAAVAHAVSSAKEELGLHRLQAATLRHNAAARRILQRAGFVEIGVAPSYLKIAGSWQDHVLFQRILE